MTSQEEALVLLARRLDLIFGLLPFERDAVDRARPVPIADEEIRICTPEDLILLKIISKRDQDLTDVQGILRRRFRELEPDPELVTGTQRPQAGAGLPGRCLSWPTRTRPDRVSTNYRPCLEST